MQEIKNDEIRQAVRQEYGKVAQSATPGCGCAPSCCSGGNEITPASAALALGYSQEEVTLAPEGSNLGLGCGSPQAIAALKAGEVVLDLGSGAGFDCFLAARQVGESGHVIGVDMTPEMISKARKNADRHGFQNVEFRLGEIEYLPVADHSVDVIISNCAINLSTDKGKVFKEAFRVLKSGGRIAISDVVATAPLPEEVKQDLALYTGCMAGAAPIREVETFLREAGFAQIKVRPKEERKAFVRDWAPDQGMQEYVVSATIEAVKP